MSDKIVSYASQIAAIDTIARSVCCKPLRLTPAQEELLLDHLRAALVSVRELAKIKGEKK